MAKDAAIPKTWQKLSEQIHYFIKSTDDFIVYLDEDLDVEWQVTTAGEKKLDDAILAKASNRLGALNAIPCDGLDRERVKSFRKMLGEGIARALEGAADDANMMFDKAEDFITARTTELARSWYMSAASKAAAVTFVLGPAIMMGLNQIFPDPFLPKAAVSLASGSLGALTSILARGANAVVSPSAGPKIHAQEGYARVLVGAVTALFVALSIHARLLFPQVDSIPAIAIIGFSAGWTERFLSTLIEQVGVPLLDSEGKPRKGKKKVRELPPK